MNEARLDEYNSYLDTRNRAAFEAARANDRVFVSETKRSVFTDINPEADALVTQLINTKAGRIIEISESYSRKFVRTPIGYVLKTDDPSRGKKDLTMMIFKNGEAIFLEGYDDVPRTRRAYQAISDSRKQPLLFVSSLHEISNVVSSLWNDPGMLSAKLYYDLMIPSKYTYNESALKANTLTRYLPPAAGVLTPGTPVPLIR